MMGITSTFIIIIIIIIITVALTYQDVLRDVPRLLGNLDWVRYWD